VVSGGFAGKLPQPRGQRQVNPVRRFPGADLAEIDFRFKVLQ
jgi:hypothetical protein